MAQVFATPTKHDLESFDPETDPYFHPLTRSSRHSELPPHKSLTKKKSIIASAFGSLRWSRLLGNQRSDPVSPSPDPVSPSTPQRPVKWKPFATLNGIRSAHKQQDGYPKESVHAPSKTEEQSHNRQVRKARRSKSLGELLGSLSGKRAQKRTGLPSVVLTSPEDTPTTISGHYKSKTPALGLPPTSAISIVTPGSPMRSCESDIFSVRDGREPLRPKSLKTTQSVADFRLPEPALGIDSPQINSQRVKNLVRAALNNMENSQRDSGISFAAEEFGARAPSACRTAQEENQLPPNSEAPCFATADYPKDSLMSPAGTKPGDQTSKGTEDDAVFGPVSKEDGFWPTSDTYLRKIVSPIGDDEPFEGPSPHACIRRKSQDLGYFPHARSWPEEVEDPCQVDRYPELTSSERAILLNSPFSSRNFRLVDMSKNRDIDSSTQAKLSERDHIMLPDTMGSDSPKGKVKRKVKIVDFDTIFSQMNVQSETKAAPIPEPQENTMSARELKLGVTLTAAEMSRMDEIDKKLLDDTTELLPQEGGLTRSNAQHTKTTIGEDSSSSTISNAENITAPTTTTTGKMALRTNLQKPPFAAIIGDQDGIVRTLSFAGVVVLGPSHLLPYPPAPTIPGRSANQPSLEDHLPKTKVIGYDNEAHRQECLAAMKEEREQDSEEERHLAFRRLATEEWNPFINNIENAIRYGLVKFDTIASWPNYAPQKHFLGWREAVLENTDLRSMAQQSFEELGIPTVTGSIPAKKRFYHEVGASVEHIEDIYIEDDIYGTTPPGSPYSQYSVYRDYSELEDGTDAFYTTPLSLESFDVFGVNRLSFESSSEAYESADTGSHEMFSFGGVESVELVQNYILGTQFQPSGISMQDIPSSSSFRPELYPPGHFPADIFPSGTRSEVETSSEVQADIDYAESVNTRQANVEDLEEATSQTSADSVWGSSVTDLASEAEFVNEKQGSQAVVNISFPRTNSHDAFTKSYRNRDEAVRDIRESYGEEISDYCVYNPQTNIISLRIKDDKCVLDIMADIDDGLELQWIPSEFDLRNSNQKESDSENFVFKEVSENATAADGNQSARPVDLEGNPAEPSPEFSMDTIGGGESTNPHLPGFVENRYLSDIEPFPDYEEHALAEPFPGYGTLPVPEPSNIDPFEHWAERPIVKLAHSKSDSCMSEAVDPALARRYLGSEFCDSYLDGYKEEKTISTSPVLSDTIFTPENENELPATFGEGSSKNPPISSADSMTKNDRVEVLRAEKLTGNPPTITGDMLEHDINKVKGKGKDTQGDEIRRDDASDNSTDSSGSVSSNVSLPSGFKFTNYTDLIRDRTLK